MKPKYIVMNTLIAVFLVNSIVTEHVANNIHALGWAWVSAVLWLLAVGNSINKRSMEELHQRHLDRANGNSEKQARTALSQLNQMKSIQNGLHGQIANLTAQLNNLKKVQAPTPSPFSKKLKVVSRK